MRGFVLPLLLAAISSHAGILPEVPPEGLRVSVSVSCDFRQRWWEVNYYPGSNLPLEVRWRTEGMRGNQPRQLTRELPARERERLYALSRAAFDDFHLDRRPPLLGDPAAGSWRGARTLTLSALILDGDLGRVDRIDLAIDLLPGRAMTAPVTSLTTALSQQATPIDMALDCR